MSDKKNLAIIIVLAAAVLGGGAWLLLFRSEPGPAVDSYQACKAEKDSMLLETYPTVCVTKDGTRFSDPAAQPFQPPSEGVLPPN